jgi:uncharacterized membrane protein YhaH (DUF805 family)
MEKYPGRMNRRNFLFGNFFLILSAISLNIIRLAVNGLILNEYFTIVLDIAILLAYLCGVAMLFSIYVYRLHDLDRGGWMAILLLLPGLNFIVFLYLSSKRGMVTLNRYGPPDTSTHFWSTFISL